MNRMTSSDNNLGNILVSAVLAVFSLFFLVLGMSYLPVLGILIAIPFMRLFICFSKPRPHPDDMEFAEGAVDKGSFCLWPRHQNCSQ